MIGKEIKSILRAEILIHDFKHSHRRPEMRFLIVEYVHKSLVESLDQIK